jgi:hypothetical protein
MRAEFHPEAELELIEAASYYELQVPGLGDDFESRSSPCYRPSAATS